MLLRKVQQGNLTFDSVVLFYIPQGSVPSAYPAEILVQQGSVPAAYPAETFSRVAHYLPTLLASFRLTVAVLGSLASIRRCHR